MLSKFSVKKPYTVVVGIVLILILGIVSFQNMTADLLPNMNLPYAAVMTTYPGASPEEVEASVTRPIEQSMATVSSIQQVQSVSQENVSMVILEFGQEADMDSVTLEMREKLDQIKGYWPEEVANPVVVKMNPTMLPIMVSAVSAEGENSADASRTITEKVLPELESIEGVASVTTSGTVEEKIEVVLQPEKIRQINDRIQEQVNQQVTQAKAALDTAKAQVESGKAALEAGTSEAASQMGQAEAELARKSAQISQAQLEIQEKLSELNLAETQIGQAQMQLEVKLQELKAQKQALQALADHTDKEGLQAEYDQLCARIEELQNTGQEIPAEMQAKKVLMEKQLDALNKFSEYMTALQEQISQLEAKKAELADSLAQIRSGKQLMEQTKTQLAAGQIGLAEVQGQISSAQVEAFSKLAEGSSALAAGESMVQLQEQQLNQAQEEISENADVSSMLTADMIQTLLAAQNFNMPAGYVEEHGIRYLIRVGDKIRSLEDLKNLTLLDTEGMDPIRLSDVADIQTADNSGSSYAKINGKNGILLSIQKQTGYSTGEVSDRLLEKMESLEKEYEGIQCVTLMDQGVYIDMVINSVLQNLVFGAVLAVLILLVFLKNYRPTLIIACSIPISILTAIVLMYFSGVTLNIISLSGLALGVGMLVDNSIVVIENIYRMRNEEQASAKTAAIEGAKQVAGAISASTLTTVCVFLPIVFTKGITRQLFIDMGLTIGYSLGASLVVALTVVPMMSAGLLKRIETKESSLFVRVKKEYVTLLSFALRKKGLVLTGVLLLLALSGIAALSRGTEFMPTMESTQMSMTVETEKGTSLEDTAAVADRVTEKIETIKDVRDIGAMISGQSITGMGGDSKNQVQYYILTEEKRTLSDQELKKEILKATKDLPCAVNISQSGMDMSSLGTSGISIEIKGKELDRLQEMAKKTAEIVKGVKGTKNVSDGMEDTTGELRVLVNKEKAAAYNLTVAQVYQELAGEVAEASSKTTLSTEDSDYDIYVSDAENTTKTRKDIQELILHVEMQDGTAKDVPLKEIADFEEAEGLQAVSRKDQSRYMNVTAELEEGENIGLVSIRVEKALKKLDIPNGYEVRMAGEDETIRESMTELMKMLGLAVIFMYLIMVAQFQSLRSPFIIMFTIPLAFTGGLLGLFLTGNAVSVIAMIGFVMLSGIIVNNGIVFVDYTNQLMEDGMEKQEALIEAGKTRLRPIIMTALTTILGLLTMAFGMGMGADMIEPMAIVTIGGLLYGTILTMFVVPCIYDLFVREKKSK